MVANLRFGNWQLGLAGLCLGAMLTVLSVYGENRANAEVRRATSAQPEQHFKSGGRLSESVLQDILVVLKRMDDRLARIESAVKMPARGGALQAAPTLDAGPDTNDENAVPEIKVRRSK